MLPGLSEPKHHGIEKIKISTVKGTLIAISATQRNVKQRSKIEWANLAKNPGTDTVDGQMVHPTPFPDLCQGHRTKKTQDGPSVRKDAEWRRICVASCDVMSIVTIRDKMTRRFESKRLKTEGNQLRRHWMQLVVEDQERVLSMMECRWKSKDHNDTRKHKK